MSCAAFNALYDRQAEYASAYLAGMVNALGQYGDPDVYDPGFMNFGPNALINYYCSEHPQMRLRAVVLFLLRAVALPGERLIYPH